MPQTEPLVAYPTASSSESVLTVLQMYNNGMYSIPDYQRDSDQWSKERKALFVESVLNNLTVPAFLLAPTGRGRYDVVDGQQRLTTLKEYYSNALCLVPNDEADYLGQRSIYYAGKTFEELKRSYPLYAQAFEGFLLTLIKLPEGVDEDTRREIFRRINEAGTPLSAQDIRLAYYGNCRSVTFIRLCGIHEKDREGTRRMVQSAQAKYGLPWPWEQMDAAVQENWANWWKDKQTAVGQTASEMFLWFLIASYANKITSLLSNENHLASALKTTFDGRTEEVADIFCAQLLHEAISGTSPHILCSPANLEQTLFPTFGKWWNELHVRMPNIGVDRCRRMALLIAAMSTYDPKNLNDDQWGKAEKFLRSPRQTAEELGIDFPESKGRWGGTRGQSAQINAFQRVAAAIYEKRL